MHFFILSSLALKFFLVTPKYTTGISFKGVKVAGVGQILTKNLFKSNFSDLYSSTLLSVIQLLITQTSIFSALLDDNLTRKYECFTILDEKRFFWEMQNYFVLALTKPGWLKALPFTSSRQLEIISLVSKLFPKIISDNL